MLMRNILRLQLLIVAFILFNATSATYAAPIDNGATGLGAATSATDTPIALDQWYTFGFFDVGSSFASGAGFVLGTDPASIAAPDPPWTFTLPSGGTLTVVDGF